MKEIFEIEILKLKNSKILWIAVLAPVFMVIQGAINLNRYFDLFTGKGQNVWFQLYTQSIIFYVSILFPVLICIIMTLIARIENTKNSWKHYLSLPVSKGKIYGIKFIIACLITFINVLVFILSIIISGKVMGLDGSIPFNIILTKPLLAYISALPIMVMLYALSIRFSHMALPLGVGIGLTLPAMLVANTKYWIFYPWTYPIIAALGNEFETFNKGVIVYIISIILLIAIFSFGYNRFKRNDIV